MISLEKILGEVRETKIGKAIALSVAFVSALHVLYGCPTFEDKNFGEDAPNNGQLSDDDSATDEPLKYTLEPNPEGINAMEEGRTAIRLSYQPKSAELILNEMPEGSMYKEVEEGVGDVIWVPEYFAACGFGRFNFSLRNEGDAEEIDFDLYVENKIDPVALLGAEEDLVCRKNEYCERQLSADSEDLENHCGLFPLFSLRGQIPSGIVINEATGLVYGTPQESGDFNTLVGAEIPETMQKDEREFKISIHDKL